MSLLSCPNEILWQIAKNLDCPALSIFLRTNRFFCQLLTPQIHKLAFQDKEELPALCWAASRGHEPLVRLLLGRGLNANGSGPEGQETPLHCAADRGEEAIVRLLLNRGAGISLNRRDSLGKTPLHNAAARGYEKVVRLLLVSGARIFARDNYSRTPFHLAVESVPAVLGRTLCGPGGWSERWRAAEQSSRVTIEALLENGSMAELNNRDDMGKTPLHWAAESGLEETKLHGDVGLVVFKLLINRGAYTHVMDHQRNTLLHTAASSGSAIVVKFLLENFMDVDARNIHQRTPLLCVTEADYCSVGTLRLLLEYGADVNARDYLGTTALQNLVFTCTEYSSPQVLKIMDILLDKGVDIDGQDLAGETALHIAVFKMSIGDGGTKEVIEFLLERGADADIKNLQGISSINWAQSTGNEAIITLFLDHEVS